MMTPGHSRSGRRAGRAAGNVSMDPQTGRPRPLFLQGRHRGQRRPCASRRSWEAGGNHTMPSMPLVLVSSDAFERHMTPPGHPERPERAHVFDAVATAWRAGGGEVRAPRPATLDELAAVHDRDHLERIAGTAGRAAMLDPDTFTSP